MSHATRHIDRLLFTICFVLVGLSIYSFWNAHALSQLLIDQAGDDPFAMVFTDETEVSATTPQGTRELIMLNIRRRRNETVGWVSSVAAVLLLSSTSILRAWKRTPQTLGISDSVRAHPGEAGTDE